MSGFDGGFVDVAPRQKGVNRTKLKVHGDKLD